MKLVMGYPLLKKPIRPEPKGPHKVEFSQGAAILVAHEDGKLRRHFLEEFKTAWHPILLPVR